jgi:hypothetical protein
MTCTHEGFHSGEGRYDHTTGTLRYVMVCDDCRTEIAQIQVQEYRPSFVPREGDDEPGEPGTNGAGPGAERDAA